MECLLFIDTPEESGIGGVNSMHKEQCSSLEGHFCSSNRLVHAYFVLYSKTVSNSGVFFAVVQPILMTTV